MVYLCLSLLTNLIKSLKTTYQKYEKFENHLSRWLHSIYIIFKFTSFVVSTYLCRLLLQDPVLQLFDGHNGSAAAIYSKENLLSNVLNAIPSDLNRDEWVAALPRALVAGFVKTDKDFQERGMSTFYSNVIFCCMCAYFLHFYKDIFKVYVSSTGSKLASRF